VETSVDVRGVVTVGSGEAGGVSAMRGTGAPP